MPLVEFHTVRFAAAVNFYIEPGTERIDNRRSYAMQAADCVIGRIPKFAACMEFRQHYFHTGHPRLFFNIYRNAAAVIGNCDGAVCMQGDCDMAACPGKGFIYRIINYFPEAVHKPLAVGGADIHAGTLAYGIKPLQD